MDLNEWFKWKDVSVDEFVKITKLCRATIYNHITKGTMPDLTIANKITLATSGAVTQFDIEAYATKKKAERRSCKN